MRIKKVQNSRFIQNLRSFYLVKVAYDFVQQPEALQTLLIDVVLVVELPVVGD